MKTCFKCKKEYENKYFAKNNSVKSGLDTYCKKCKSILSMKSAKLHPERVKHYAKKYYLENIDLWKNRDSRPDSLKRYSLTKDDYILMFKKQNGVCAICLKQELNGRNLSVDHSHKCCSGRKSCGKCVRGLLCTKCNKMIGLANDNIDILTSTINYIIKY